MHDPVGVRAVLFREFGFCPFGDKVSQYLRLDGLPWFVYYVERKELDSSFSNPARGVAVIYYAIEWYFRGHHNQTLLKVVSQLPGCHEDHICYFFGNEGIGICTV